MNVAFAGPREGMTALQAGTLAKMVCDGRYYSGSDNAASLHHGDCVGADDEACTIVNRCNPLIRIIAHPGKLASGSADHPYRARNRRSHETRPVNEFHARTRDMIDECDELCVTPENDEPITIETKGGTAYAVNYARERRKPIVIILPDGSVKLEHPNADSVYRSEQSPPCYVPPA